MTQATEEAVVYRPYHETIIDAIRRSPNEGLQDLAPFIKRTIIPDPDAIDAVIAAWKRKTHEMCWNGEDLGVPVALLKQKEALLASKGSKSIVKFEELALEAESLHGLLSDRRPGNPNWTLCFKEQVHRMHKLLSSLVH